ncbi:MMPL family transporter [Phytoactinopolyspora halotolerans]|uniref:MMPL family transporter n=1 Tax=Phytoactinopolyspora halotolerans TaxID=1981512 RepID=A0A6L9S0V4_9ACTN|nr:MMPL family transporter [Phytoactinopolyspora halotolerans]NED98636.1 MMPL family transporter [Phytoactinopolyspora halotolerans]
MTTTATPHRTSGVARLAGLALRHRRAVLITAALLALVAGSSGATLFSKLSAGGWTDPNAESGEVSDILEETFGQDQPNLVLLVSAPRGVDDPGAVDAGAELTERLAAEPGVSDVVSYWATGQESLRNDDGDKALILAGIEGDPNEVDATLTELIPSYGGEQDGLTVTIGGYAMFEHELTEQSERDVIKAELIVFPVTLIALVLIFGSIVAAMLPLAVAMVTVLVGMGVMWVLAEVTDLAVLAVNVVTLLGLGLAIDYSLLMVNRYREELRRGRPVAAAIETTMRTAGRTVIFSAVTVAIALSALVWFPLDALRSVSYAGMATALLAGAAALTVLPATFALLGRRLERTGRRRRRPAGVVEQDTAESGMWHRIATLVMRRPIPIATLVAAFLLVLGAPFLNLNLGEVDERTMPETAQSRQVSETIRAEFGSGEQNALQVVVTEDAEVTDEEIAGYATQVSQLDHVARVDTVTGSYAGGEQIAPAGPAHQRFAADGARYLHVVPLAGDSQAAQDLVETVRATPAPSDVLVGGLPAVTVDGNDALTSWLPYSMAALAICMVVLLFLLTGSVVLPFLALLLSGLSLTATFGALVWIFQEGNLTGLLGGFTVTGSLAGTVPVMLFAVAFGLAMDYQVFMLSRIREEYERTGDGTAAVAEGLERIGRIVTAAAVLISIVFLAFLFSEITLMKAFGIGLPLAVLLDATLIRGAMLPAMMKICGRSTWWAPAPLRRLHARFGLRETDDAPSSTESESVAAAR